ncbi:hypothetical protein PT974_07689 [Cladobotryum mycophilum]|uniref:Uncharacterized protein n=1 Tax=Cladobotryum mycophilum TaxID=491253 RepID=A0ABR0SIY0_9HYPO
MTDGAPKPGNWAVLIGTDDSESFMQVKLGDTVKFMVENLGTGPLCLTIVEIGPSWQVDNVGGEDESADFKIVPPKTHEGDHRPQDTGIQQIELEMAIPESFLEQGIRECDDILKIFVTNSATSLSVLSMP